MNKQAIEARLAKLRAEKEQNEGKVQNGLLLREAYHGAIQDCEFWLGEIAKEERDAAEAKSSVESSVEQSEGRLLEMRKGTHETVCREEAMRGATA